MLLEKKQYLVYDASPSKHYFSFSLLIIVLYAHYVAIRRLDILRELINNLILGERFALLSKYPTKNAGTRRRYARLPARSTLPTARY